MSDEEAQRLVAMFLKKKENERLALMAAEAQKTTVEKIVPYLTYFVRQFVDRWSSIPQDVRRNALRDLGQRIIDLLMFILKAMVKRN